MTDRPPHPNLYFYVNELQRQAAHHARAFSEVQAAVEVNDHEAMLYHAQAMLSAAAQISKLLWPPSERKWSPERRAWATARGERLREICQPDAVLNDRNVRNGLEHFDERLDTIYFDRPDALVAPPFATGNALRWMIPEMPQLRYLHIHDGALVFSVLEASVDLPQLATAIATLRQRLDALDHHELYASEARIAGLPID